MTVTMIASEAKSLETTHVVTSDLPPLQDGQVRLRVSKVGLSANNKFYMDFGNKKPFCFFQAWPVPPGDEDDDDDGRPKTGLVNVPAWGLATVVESVHPGVAVGGTYRGFLHMTDQAQLTVEPTPGGFAAVRPGVLPSYNGFERVENGSILSHSEDTKSDVAVAVYPGAITGFGLYHHCKFRDFFGAESVVLISASSKVALMTAFMLKKGMEEGGDDERSVIGYTSPGNRDFLEATGLYDRIILYEDDVPEELNRNLLLIDIAGRGEVYKKLEANTVKTLAIGNSHGVPDESSTFSSMSFVGTAKMMMTMMGGPRWLTNHLNPKLELFLIMDFMEKAMEEWGQEEFKKRNEESFRSFVETAIGKSWIRLERFESLESIQEAFVRICRGTVAPSEAVVLDVARAVKNGK